MVEQLSQNCEQQMYIMQLKTMNELVIVANDEQESGANAGGCMMQKPRDFVDAPLVDALPV